ncbi:MAG: hypothetical protein H7315_17795 [Herminiimonas sp.]|nr:hypothetical protein [Herminiimonas sp.]
MPQSVWTRNIAIFWKIPIFRGQSIFFNFFSLHPLVSDSLWGTIDYYGGGPTLLDEVVSQLASQTPLPFHKAERAADHSNQNVPMASAIQTGSKSVD